MSMYKNVVSSAAPATDPVVSHVDDVVAPVVDSAAEPSSAATQSSRSSNGRTAPGRRTTTANTVPHALDSEQRLRLAAHILVNGAIRAALKQRQKDTAVDVSEPETKPVSAASGRSKTKQPVTAS